MVVEHGTRSNKPLALGTTSPQRESTRRLLLTVLLIGGTAAGCTESDPVNREIGTTLIFFAEPGLQPQGFIDIDSRVQAANWDIQEALLDLEGNRLDLLFGEACLYTDSVSIFPIPEGKCGGGIVIDSRLDPQPIPLTVTFTMQVKRARPPTSLLGGRDFDGDGRLDDGDGSGLIGDAPCTAGQSSGCDDNCVLEFNPDQQDLDENGIGDTCSLIDPFTGATALDSDLDGTRDIFDNCLWTPNPFQADTSGSVPDGIGDACDEQTAEVQLGGSAVIQLTLGTSLAQRLLSTSFLTVDFNGSISNCDWNAGTCDLDPMEVDFCVSENVTSAAFGCF